MLLTLDGLVEYMNGSVVNWTLQAILRQTLER